ncbi:hypothetical protein AAFC00_003150 [Neodothiora populina]|uniref:Glycosyltransferase family 34 protein n=1 Tax=Neodothiora populina TaxID=2781224 RepID=A0ABR3P9T2_9PEZI
MLATSGILRSFGLAVGAILILFGLLCLSISIPTAPHSQIDAFEKVPHEELYNGTEKGFARIKKVSALIGERNHLYERALKTHERHNEIHGYEMQVLRERITSSYWAKPSWLLAMLVEELARPELERNEWLVWCDPDTIILNPLIPLETFLPPKNMTDVHMIATHDPDGLNTGVLFFRVCEWTFKFLIDVLAVPLRDGTIQTALSKDAPAIEKVLDYPNFRGRTIYEPRGWFNAFHAHGYFEASQGSMLVHFTDVNGDKWNAMDQYLKNVTAEVNPWKKRLNETAYEIMLHDFWNRVTQAKDLLTEFREKERDNEVREAADKLRHALDHRTDDFDKMIAALIGLRKSVKKPRQSE